MVSISIEVTSRHHLLLRHVASTRKHDNVRAVKSVKFFVAGVFLANRIQKPNITRVTARIPSDDYLPFDCLHTMIVDLQFF